VVSPADAAADATRFVAPAGEDVTRVAVPDDALTIAAPSDSAGDAMTVATPVARTTHKPRAAGRRSKSDTGPLEVGQSFGPRYHIIRMLGVGGMGAVYQAWDAELGVAVAIKVIRPEVMEDPMMAEEVSRRFKRELLLARQVTHKNVVRIHDLGDIDGIKYITMSYVEGTDLATILKRDGKRSVRELLHIARAVINGLVAAHTAGVVHRDLKPANIMIGKDGEALIMDFGIAHSTGDASASSAAAAGTIPEHLRRAAAQSAGTTVGAVVGTLEYMAPEQAKGQPVDQRADVYAFGLILYDAFLGQRRAASGASAVEELQRRMTAPPPPLQALVPDVPAPLAALIARCVEPDAEKRFQTSAEVAAELDRLDEDGKLIPIRKTIGLPLMAAVVAVLTVVFGGSWWYFREPLPVMHDDMSVLIADFTNMTGDAGLDHTLEPMIRLALEEAGFITAIDRTQMRPRLAVPAPPTLDEKIALDTAAKHGVGVVLAGSIAKKGTQFELEAKAVETFSGKVLATVRERARTRNEVLAAATNIAVDVRQALGDDTSDTTRRFASDTLSATSIDVVRNYAAAMEAQADGRFPEALASFQKTLDGDPDFGLAYAGMASSSRNLGRIQDAEKYAIEAARHVDRMTVRERYRARGLKSMATGDYQQCLEEFQQMLKQYSADVVAHNNVAFCQTQLRRMSDAVASTRHATDILPKRALYRLNLALYLAYAGEFAAAEAEAKTTQDLGNTYGLLPAAFAQLGQERTAEALKAYQDLLKVNPQAAPAAASGIADLAVYEGRFGEAVKLYEAGAKTDLEQKNPDRAAAKLAALAYAELQRQRIGPARAAAGNAIAASQAIRPRLLAARVLVEAGDIPGAQAVAAQLAKEPQVEAKASAKVLLGSIAIKKGDYDTAIMVLTEANTQLDTWMGQFELGRARLAAGQYTAADSAFDRCITRSGELFLDEEATYGLLPAVYYLQGQAREASKSLGYVDLYRRYLRIREKAGEDPVLKDVRRRAGR
jgi:serine/threonine protein kinase/Tfp pilus assembly protein PilF